MTHNRADSSTIQELLAHADWVYSLAGQLVPDSHTAEDLAQETLIRAFERPPAHLQYARAWLATVLRNLVANRLRSESRLRQREEHAAAPEVLPSTSELVERAHLQRELVEHVLELDEHYREVLLLHFFECLAPRYVAQRLGIPVNTVHTRISRGLAKLREALDRKHSQRNLWVKAFTPLLTSQRCPQTPTTGLESLVAQAATHLGALLMNAKIVAVAASILLLAVTIQLMPSRPESPDFADRALQETTATSWEPSADHSTGVVPLVPKALPNGLRKAVQSIRKNELLALDETRRITGRAVDEYGQPMAHIELQLSTPKLDKVQAVIAKLLTIRAGENEPSTAKDLTAFENDPLGFLEAQPTPPLDAFWVRNLIVQKGTVPSARTDASGRFQLQLPRLSEDIEALGQIRFVALTPGIVVVGGGKSTGPPGRPSERVVVTAPQVTLSGITTTSNGTPVEGALLSFNLQLQLLRHLPWALTETWVGPRTASAVSDKHGRFSMEYVALLDGIGPLVQKEGFKNQRIALAEVDQRNVHIVLERFKFVPATVLRGLILDTYGNPVEGATARIFGTSSKSDSTGGFTLKLPTDPDLECDLLAVKQGFQPAVIRGTEVIRRSREELILVLGAATLSITGSLNLDEKDPRKGWMVSLRGKTSFGSSSRSLEAASAPGNQQADMWEQIHLDTPGDFTFAGLLDKPYTLVFWNENSGQSFQVGPIAAGTQNIAVSIPTPQIVSAIWGRVVDSLGHPVESARIDLALTTGNIMGSPSRKTLFTETSDQSGNFHFTNIPQGKLEFQVSGPGISASTMSIFPDPFSKGPLRLEAECFWRFVPKLAPNDLAEHFQVVDSDGKPLMLRLQRQGVTSLYKTAPLRANAFLVVETSLRATELILFAGGKPLRRVPLDPKRGPVQTLEL